MSEASLMMSPMLTLAATITRPASAAVAPAMATLNSDHASMSFMARMVVEPSLGAQNRNLSATRRCPDVPRGVSVQFSDPVLR